MARWKQFGPVPLLALVMITSPVRAEVTFEIICPGFATGISADGSVVSGNTEWYEAFRWTADAGQVTLGRLAGHPAGIPGISADGTRISSTIGSLDGTYTSQGMWTLGEGWQETMPPVPDDGGMMDSAYGSAWGLSDDGQVLVGLYWRPGQTGGLAHACRWTEETGVQDLGSGGGNSRANDASYDGSVIVGWDETEFGNWQPTVWVDGVRTILSENEWFCEATAVVESGEVILGYTADPAGQRLLAATWTWDGDAWQERLIGALPGNHPIYGLASPSDATPDGSVIVGYNRFTDPYNATGFIWTEEAGMVDVEDFLIDNGVVLPPRFDIRSLNGISDDGTVMVGSGQERDAPFTNRSFIIHLDAPVSVDNGPWVETRVLQLRAAPNPTAGPTTLALELSEGGPLSVSVFDGNGRLIRELFRGPAEVGPRQVQWNGMDAGGRQVPLGVYFFRVETGRDLRTEKIVVVR